MDSFEKHIIKKLNEHSTPYSAKVWENVSFEINKVEERRRFLAWPFFLSFGVLLLLGGLFTYLYKADSSLFNQSPAPFNADLALSNQVSSNENNDLDKSIFKPSEKVVSIPIIKKPFVNNLKAENISTNDIDFKNSQETEAIFSKSTKAISTKDKIIDQKNETTNVSRSRLDVADISILDTKLIISKTKRKKKSRLTKICPEFNDSRPRLSATTYIGPSLVSKTLSAKSYEAQPYESARKSMESDWISFSAGLRFDYRFYNNFYLSSGLEYEQITEKLEFDDASEERIQTVITIDTLIVGIDTTTVSDTSRVIVQGVREVRNFNSFRSFNVPVLLGYKLDVSPNLSVGINTGASFNIFRSHSGKIINDQFDIAEYDSTGESDFQPYNTDLSIALTGNINVNYAISQKWSWFAESGFQYYLDPISTDAYILNQRYSLTKLRLGTTFKF